MAKRRVEPLPGPSFAQLASALPHGEALTGTDGSTQAAPLATAVDAAISLARGSKTPLSDEQITGLGVLWGKAVSQATGWTWAELIEDETRLICLVAQDHAHVCVPLAFVREQLEATTPCTALVLFNIIREGNLPPAEMEDLVFAG